MYFPLAVHFEIPILLIAFFSLCSYIKYKKALQKIGGKIQLPLMIKLCLTKPSFRTLTTFYQMSPLLVSTDGISIVSKRKDSRN